MARITPTGKGGSLLDNGVAALAALSSGFLVYAMPEGLFSRIVVASRLPQFLAAAQPPLGMKARLAVIAVAALVVYAFVWSLMRALDSIGRKPRAAAVFEEAPQSPRLRRADAHPDAPAPRPIFAGRDLGEPEGEEEPLELEAEAAFAPEAEIPYEPWAEVASEPEPEPSFEAEGEAPFEAEPAPEPEPEFGSSPLPAFLVPQQPEPEAWDAPEQPAAYDEEPISFAASRAAEPVETPAAWHREEPADEYYDEYGEEEEEEAGPETESESDEQSLARLMQRFESGLTRKQQALSAPPPVAVPEPEPAPQERVGHRLRSAISDLGKISAPGR